MLYHIYMYVNMFSLVSSDLVLFKWFLQIKVVVDRSIDRSVVHSNNGSGTSLIARAHERRTPKNVTSKRETRTEKKRWFENVCDVSINTHVPS
jgi:hypothetical protein